MFISTSVPPSAPATVSPRLPQSVTTKPGKPHSPFSTERFSQALWLAWTPHVLLYAPITVSRPPSFTAISKAGR